MTEHIFTYRDSSYNPDRAYHYELLILVEEESFSYAIIDDKQLVVYEANRALSELKGELQDTLSGNYKNVIVGISSTGFSLLPASLFKTENADHYARLLDVKANEQALAQSLDGQNHIVYKIDDRLIPALNIGDTQKSVFAATGWIKAVAQTRPAENQLFINIKHRKIEVLNFNSNLLRFYNQFDYKMEDDAIYYAALAAKELELNTTDVTIILSGDIDANHQLFYKLSEFFDTIKFNDITPITLPEELAAHQLLQLTALSVCG